MLVLHGASTHELLDARSPCPGSAAVVGLVVLLNGARAILWTNTCGPELGGRVYECLNCSSVRRLKPAAACWAAGLVLLMGASVLQSFDLLSVVLSVFLVVHLI